MSGFGFVFNKALSVRVARVLPVAEKSFAISRNAPEQATVFQLRVFLDMDAVHEQGASLSPEFN